MASPSTSLQGDTPLHRVLLGLLHRVQGYDAAECEAMMPDQLSSYDVVTLMFLSNAEGRASDADPVQFHSVDPEAIRKERPPPGTPTYPFKPDLNAIRQLLPFAPGPLP